MPSPPLPAAFRPSRRLFWLTSTALAFSSAAAAGTVCGFDIFLPGVRFLAPATLVCGLVWSAFARRRWTVAVWLTPLLFYVAVRTLLTLWRPEYDSLDHVFGEADDGVRHYTMATFTLPLKLGLPLLGLGALHGLALWWATRTATPGIRGRDRGERIVALTSAAVSGLFGVLGGAWRSVRSPFDTYCAAYPAEEWPRCQDALSRQHRDVTEGLLVIGLGIIGLAAGLLAAGLARRREDERRALFARASEGTLPTYRVVLDDGKEVLRRRIVERAASYRVAATKDEDDEEIVATEVEGYSRTAE